MKNVLKLAAMLLCVVIMTSMWSCNTKSNQESSSSSKSENTSISKDDPKISNQEVTNTFTDKYGRTHRADEVLKEYYETGTSEGVNVHSAGLENNPFNDYGTEESFKRSWVFKYGIPESSEAKEVYNKALKKYKEGYAAGLKF